MTNTMRVCVASDSTNQPERNSGAAAWKPNMLPKFDDVPMSTYSIVLAKIRRPSAMVHSRLRVGADSLLACNLHVRPPTRDPRARLVGVAGDALLWAIGEPRRSEFRPGDPQALLTHTGWTPEPWIEADDEEFDGRLLLVRASP
jgi:hypothetical protein